MQATSDSEKLEGLLEPLRANPTGSAIFADLDGTIAPIVKRSEDAMVTDEVRQILAALARRYALVGCITGRRAAEARRLVGVGGLAYIGIHGFERILPGAHRAEVDPSAAGHESAAGRFADGLDAREMRAVELRIEDKGPIWALHWRGASDEEAAEARAREIAAEAMERGLVPHWGRKVLEIRPAVDLNKGTALAEILEERRIERALYAGDDRTDLDAFRALRTMARTGDLKNAVCIGVASAEGPSEISEEADLSFPGTEDFLAVLRALTD